MLNTFHPKEKKKSNQTETHLVTHPISFYFIYLFAFFYVLRFFLFIIYLSSTVDEYGFKRDEDFDYKSYDNIMSSYYTVLTRRRMKWQQYLKNPSVLHNNRSRKLKRYVRKGIPSELSLTNLYY